MKNIFIFGSASKLTLGMINKDYVEWDSTSGSRFGAYV